MRNIENMLGVTLGDPNEVRDMNHCCYLKLLLNILSINLFFEKCSFLHKRCKMSFILRSSFKAVLNLNFSIKL